MVLKEKRNVRGQCAANQDAQSSTCFDGRRTTNIMATNMEIRISLPMSFLTFQLKIMMACCCERRHVSKPGTEVSPVADACPKKEIHNKKNLSIKM
jgi:hypothetical protein